MGAASSRVTLVSCSWSCFLDFIFIIASSAAQAFVCILWLLDSQACRPLGALFLFSLLGSLALPLGGQTRMQGRPFGQARRFINYYCSFTLFERREKVAPIGLCCGLSAGLASRACLLGGALCAQKARKVVASRRAQRSRAAEQRTVRARSANLVANSPPLLRSGRFASTPSRLLKAPPQSQLAPT